MNIREYYAFIQSIIGKCPLIISSNISFEEIDLDVGYLKGVVEFVDGSSLHFMEFVGTSKAVQRLKYKYHWLSRDRTLISRWDNVPHHRDIDTFPHHVHDEKGVHPSQPMDFKMVLEKITEKLI